MAFGSARQRFLEAATPHDDSEPTVTQAALQAVLDLVRDAKKVEALVKRAADAQKVIDQAAKVAATLEEKQRKADDSVVRAKDAIAKERAAFEAEVALELAKAERAAEEAAADRAEAKRRLQAVEKAVAGS